MTTSSKEENISKCFSSGPKWEAIKISESHKQIHVSEVVHGIKQQLLYTVEEQLRKPF